VNGTPLTIGNSVVAAPMADDDSRTALAEALEILRLLRDGEMFNAADRLTALASIAAEVDAELSDAVADAVDQGFPFEQVAHCAGVNVSAARRRYASANPRTPAVLD
jgi:hypothetical protein